MVGSAGKGYEQKLLTAMTYREFLGSQSECYAVLILQQGCRRPDAKGGVDEGLESGRSF